MVRGCVYQVIWECDAFSCTAKPPALNWNVSKSEDKFQINWDNPDISADWEITIKYKECDELKVKKTQQTLVFEGPWKFVFNLSQNLSFVCLWLILFVCPVWNCT